MNSVPIEPNEFKPIVLNVQPIDAERIYSLTEEYELRTSIPKDSFNVVFFYESAPVSAITGFFISTRTISASAPQLWEIVRKKGKSKEKFDSYFKTNQFGHAIEIQTVYHLDYKINLDGIPTSTADMLQASSNFVCVKDFLALEFFYRFYRRALLLDHQKVILEAATTNDFSTFTEYIMKVIDREYEDVGEDYAAQLIDAHLHGFERQGFMSLGKTIYRVKSGENHIGYVVLTSKRGGSVKSGPVILFEEFQNRGYGKQMRDAIEDVALSIGSRKVYATVPAFNRIGVNYLLSSAYKIEAHLIDHYRSKGDEIVFGKILYRAPARAVSDSFIESISSEELSLQRARGSKAEVSFLQNHMLEHFGLKVNPDWCLRLLHDQTETSIAPKYTLKPRQIFIVTNEQGRIYGIFIVALKRSKMAKVFPILNFNAQRLLCSVIQALEGELDFRKIFFVVPTRYHSLYEVLKERNYTTEGLLREPYSPGSDIMILSQLAT